MQHPNDTLINLILQARFAWRLDNVRFDCAEARPFVHENENVTSLRLVLMMLARWRHYEN